MSALAATTVRMPAVAAAPMASTAGLPEAETGPEPQELRWDGEPQGWWSRNGLAFGLGAGFGVTAGIGAAAMANSFGRATPQVAAIGAAAALGIGAMTFGITSLIRSQSDKVPNAPTGPVPSLPAATPLEPVR